MHFSVYLQGCKYRSIVHIGQIMTIKYHYMNFILFIYFIVSAVYCQLAIPANCNTTRSGPLGIVRWCNKCNSDFQLFLGIPGQCIPIPEKCVSVNNSGYCMYWRLCVWLPVIRWQVHRTKTKLYNHGFGNRVWSLPIRVYCILQWQLHRNISISSKL